MITSLRDLSMKDFIRLLCGENTVLVERGEVYSDREVRSVAEDLKFAYRMIVSPAEAKVALMDYAEEIRQKSVILACDILSTMEAMSLHKDVADSLRLFGYPDVKPERIPSVISRMRAEAERNLHRLKENRTETEDYTPEQIASSYDAECAALMTFFRMQIDVGKMSASVYANMLHQALEQVRKMDRSSGY